MNDLVIYNKLSYYFNILNVNFEEKITVFEGYLDSLFFPNSIGLVGVNTDFRFLESNNLDLQYFFDNDEAGYKKSEEKLNHLFASLKAEKASTSVADVTSWIQASAQVTAPKSTSKMIIQKNFFIMSTIVAALIVGGICSEK